MNQPRSECVCGGQPYRLQASPRPGARAQVYSQLEDGSSQVVNTAWALIALITAGYHRRDRVPLAAAARALLRAQVLQN